MCLTKYSRTQDRISQLQENMAEMLERQNNVVDPDIQAVAAGLDQIDFDHITVQSLECKICCERDNDKTCLPVGVF